MLFAQASAGTPNEQKVSDTPERQGPCGKAEGAKGAGAWDVTRRRVRSTAGLGDFRGRITRGAEIREKEQQADERECDADAGPGAHYVQHIGPGGHKW